MSLVSDLVGERIMELEAALGSNPFFPDDPYMKRFLANKLDLGGGEGDTNTNFRVPFEIDEPTVTISRSYKGDTNLEDVDMTDVMQHQYEWADADILVYKREASLAANKGGGKSLQNSMDLRVKNAGRAVKKKIYVGMYQGDGASASVLSGFPSFWYGATYGGKTRTDFAERLDSASATLITDGGTGTKFTDGTAKSGTAILDWLYETSYAVSINGTAPNWHFMDPINFGLVRKALGDKSVVNLNELNEKASPGKPPKAGLLFEHGYIVLVERRLITRGHVFSINDEFVSIASVEGAEFDKFTPFNEVPVPTKKGGAIDVQFQVSGKVFTNWCTAHVWGTGIGTL